MNISIVEYLTDDDVEELKRFLSKDFDAISVYTGDSAVLHWGDGQIYYRIEGEHPAFDEPFLMEEHSEWFELCDCNECFGYNKDRFEYYSVYRALKFVKANFPPVPITLSVDSSAFLADAADGFYLPDRGSCPKLNGFMTELFELLWSLGIADVERESVLRNS